MSLLSSGRGVFRARLADVNVFADKIKSPSRAVSSQIAQLHFAALVFRGDTGVYSDSHGAVPRDCERKQLTFRSLED